MVVLSIVAGTNNAGNRGGEGIGTHDTLGPILASPPDRPIGLLHATAMVVGIIIGAAIFVQPSEINRHVPTVPGVLAVWIAAGILTLFGALVCAQLSAAFPRTGGVYVFLKETLSPAFGFLWGWAMFWSAHSGIIAASSVIFARYVAYFVPLDDLGTVSYTHLRAHETRHDLV